MDRDPAAYRANAFTAGISDNAPRKNAVACKKKCQIRIMKIVHSARYCKFLLELQKKQTLME